MLHYYPLGVLIPLWVLWAWGFYLDFRQYKKCKTTTKVPEELKEQMDQMTFEKSKAYSIDKARVELVASIYNQLLFSITIMFYIMPYFWNLSHDLISQTFGFTLSSSLNLEIFQSLIFTFISLLAMTIVRLPIIVYNTFVVEQRHGFNKQTAKTFAWDYLKIFSGLWLISVPVIVGTICIARHGGPYFFLYLWIFCFVVVCAFTALYSEMVTLSSSIVSLPEGELRDLVEKLAKEVNFPLANIFIVKGSKRSSHSNAYYSGIFGSKRIILYDTLIEGFYDNVDDQSGTLDKQQNKERRSRTYQRGCNNEEILAVLCHEFGHWHYSHLMKNLAFAEINYFVMFVIFSWFYNEPILYRAFGFADEMPIIIGLVLMILLLNPYNQLIGFVAIAMRRKFEYQSDEFAKRMGYAQKLKNALVKLDTDNLNFPIYDKLYSNFKHVHPTLIQRIRCLDHNI